MKKQHSLAEFLKSKSFYALLCVGALAIIAITMVGLNQSSNNNSKNNTVDLNEPIISDVAENEDIPDVGEVADDNNTNPLNTANIESGNPNEVAGSNEDDVTNPLAEGNAVDIYENDALVASGEEHPINTEPVKEAENTSEVKDNEATSTQSNEPVKEVMKPETLYFDDTAGLLWPIVGDVIRNYSVDAVKYDPTLEQFRTNPAIAIKANVGDSVLSSAKGIVTSITNEDETGLTVTVSIGSGYSLVYGQLQDLTIEIGDTILEGDILGSIANPSKYYVVDGSNLYFQVLKDEVEINPMLLLRSND
jgi:murein DD-endopeptidase MepM/ murein hydrolase activator NlpD